MAYSLTWLPKVLLDAGLKVAPVPGWENRGLGDVDASYGVLCHHTAGPKSGNMPSLRILVEGRQDLPGPLSQLGLGRDGTYYVIAAGRANHAGPGMWAGITQGNRHLIGIEAENTGAPDDPWPPIQMDAYRHGVAALLKHLRLDAERCAGHKEYALPKGRKPDPSFEMSSFRADVAQILGGAVAAPAAIPNRENGSDRASPGRATLRRGALGDGVKQIQGALGVPASGIFDALTEAEVRAFQRTHQLVPDGIVGPKSWALLDRRSG